MLRTCFLLLVSRNDLRIVIFAMHDLTTPLIIVVPIFAITGCILWAWRKMCAQKSRNNNNKNYVTDDSDGYAPDASTIVYFGSPQMETNFTREPVRQATVY